MISEAYVFGNECTIKFSPEVPHTMVNTIRRTLMLDLAELAPTDVTIHKNTSVYPCELLAHRIGLVPIISECTNISLQAVGPCTLYSDSIVCKDTGKPVTEPGIMLFPLGTGHEINFSCKLTKETGRKHARFVHCSSISMKKCSVGNTLLEKECWCGANFKPKETEPSFCSRCNCKKYSTGKDHDVHYVLSYKTINPTVHPITYTMRAIDVVYKKIGKLKEVASSRMECS
ncbi:putative DNA-directed RNA polymerase subunit [Emiliania huxleyi virus 86]|uniref:Putative DNA-directed RNA polymerase subunit n=1 Tax=Emiliania huxleyi virus 86 (isolate United Kingdom/English Channel/1999) TaxID=654925 RepID=Q4A280_EHV8U|nr:putative DNA-directed RNA polymerase subunit [Emiliania huxleyi virus 86]AEO97935.1 hypothetical protein ENVG_00037 [Emiliania huxleyi virus 84]AEP15147.1 hypothetical protein EOVG_00210 [Emiliania huxleyi virus 88]AHA55014.1 putative DNA-directed RNA polymerase subunit [Emiliania huxleyi virus 145]CAI65826.1 putative DNA-directed RNA polymerase subunit [Emiliania huxleyi virus 86]